MSTKQNQPEHTDPGELFKQTVKESGINQKGISAMTGIPQVTMSYYSTGKLVPGPRVLKRLAEALGKGLKMRIE